MYASVLKVLLLKSFLVTLEIFSACFKFENIQEQIPKQSENYSAENGKKSDSFKITFFDSMHISLSISNLES